MRSPRGLLHARRRPRTTTVVQSELLGEPKHRRSGLPLSALITTHGHQIRLRLLSGSLPVHTAGLEADDVPAALAEVRHALTLLGIRETHR